MKFKNISNSVSSKLKFFALNLIVDTTLNADKIALRNLQKAIFQMWFALSEKNRM